MQTYDLDAIQWNFPLLLAGFGSGPSAARLVEFSINDHSLLPLIPEAQRTMPVLRLDNEIGLESFKKWNNYRRRAAILKVRDDEKIAFSEVEEREFRGMTDRIIEIIEYGYGDGGSWTMEVKINQNSGQVSWQLKGKLHEEPIEYSLPTHTTMAQGKIISVATDLGFSPFTVLIEGEGIKTAIDPMGWVNWAQAKHGWILVGTNRGGLLIVATNGR
jgi:hypothetical protein